jgi:hypothetical protein
MANKEAVFTVKVNTGNSVQDLQNADKAVNQLNKDLKTTQTTAKDSSGTDAMTQRLAELDARLEAGGLSMREMTQTMKEYQTIAIQAGASSPIGAQALQNAAGLKDEIGDLKAQTMALSSDFKGLDTAMAGIEVGASAFMGVQSAMALAGVENEKLTQTMVKLQAVQGLVNSVTTIANKLNSDSILGIQLRTAWEKLKNSSFVQGTVATTAQTTAIGAQTGATIASATATATATGGMKLFRLALISTGIGALVIGLGLLIANFDKVSAFVLKAREEFEKLGPGVKIAVAIAAAAFAPLLIVIYGVVKALEYFGVVDDVQTAKMKKNAHDHTEAVIKASDKRAKAIKKEQDATDAKYTHEINMAKASGKDTYEMELMKAKAHLNSGRVFLEVQKSKMKAIQEEMELLLQNEDVDSDRYKALKKRLESAKKIISDSYKDNVATKNAIEVMVAEHNHEVQKKADDNAKKAFDVAQKNREKIQEAEAKANEKTKEDLKKHNNQMIAEEEARDEAIRRSKMSARDLELSDIQDEYFQKKEQAKLLGEEGAQLVAQLTAEEETKKAEVRQKYADAQLKIDAENETKRRDRQKLLNDILLDDEQKALFDLNQTSEDAKKELLRRLNSTDENERITKEQHDLALIALEQKKIDKIEEINKTASDNRNEQAIKDREESLKGVTDFLAGAQKVLDHVKTVDALMDEIDQARLNKIEGRRDEDLANLDAKMQAELSAEGLTAQQKTDIEQKFAQQKYAVQLQAYNAEEKIKKAQFNRDKAIKLGQVAIDTASAIVKAIAQFGPPPSPAGIAGIASAGVIGVTQALAIANQQYKSGSAPSAPNFSTAGGGGGGAMAGAGASSFTASNTQTSTAGLLGEQGATTSNIPSSQVFVLESDISATQNKVKLQESKTSF